jgi:hypothetical protein
LQVPTIAEERSTSPQKGALCGSRRTATRKCGRTMAGQQITLAVAIVTEL